MGTRSTTTANVQLLAGIYREHLGRVRWVLRARGIATDELDDVVHDVFLGIHRRLPARDEGLELSSWVCGVARSVAFAHRRGAARRREATAAVPEPDARPLPDEEPARREAWQRLSAVLGGLHDDQREAFVLIDVMGMRAAEVAQLVDAPVNTVYSRLRLARRHCEHALALPEAVDRAAWLRAAVQGELPSVDTRRRAWAGITAALGGTSVASTGITAWATAGVLALAAITGAAVLVPSPSADLPRANVHASPTPTPREAAVPVAVVMPHAATPALAVQVDVPPRSRAPAPARPERAEVPTTDALAEAVETLRGGRAELADGRSAAALQAVDRYRARFGEGPLLRDLLRLERGAACVAKDERRAAAATSALIELALVPVDERPCP